VIEAGKDPKREEEEPEGLNGDTGSASKHKSEVDDTSYKRKRGEKTGVG